MKGPTGLGVGGAIAVLLACWPGVVQAQYDAAPNAQVQERITNQISAAQRQNPGQEREAKKLKRERKAKPTPTVLLEGNVAEVSPLARSVTVLTPRSNQLQTLTVVSGTSLTRGGRAIGLGDIQPGARVRAFYAQSDGQLVAEAIQISNLPPRPAAVVQPGASGAAPLLGVAGQVIDKSDLGRTVTVLDPDRSLVVQLDVGRGQVLRDGTPSSLGCVELGDQVRASYQPLGTDRVVQSLAAQTSPSSFVATRQQGAAATCQG